MFSIRVFCVVAMATSGLVLSTPASAAPKNGSEVAPWANLTVLVKEKHRDRDWSNSGGSGRQALREGRRNGEGRGSDITRRSDRQRSHDGDRHRSRHSDRNWRRDGDRHRSRHSDRNWRRDGDRHRSRHSDRNWRRDGTHDRGRHYGWRRGHHYGWDKGRKHAHWRARHHPRHTYWVGRRAPRVNYIVIDNYDDYYLPPPRYGHFYARIDNDVYLIAEGTKRIIDAFVLFDAVGR